MGKYHLDDEMGDGRRLGRQGRQQGRLGGVTLILGIEPDPAGLSHHPVNQCDKGDVQMRNHGLTPF